jgi:5-methylcytosine-specific restriction endonuclease McrA
MEFHHIFEDGTRNIYCCDPNDINIINFNDIKKICDENKIEWKNQTLTNVIGQIKDNYFDEKNGRVKFNKEQRTMLLNKFNNKCNTCQCCINDNNFHIDHITSLAGGGTNEECNLQVLCPSCHRDKCSSEHEQGQYIKPKETASFFNSEVRDIMNSDLAQQHAFVEKAYYDEIGEDKKLFCIDINKCRRNILKYSNFDYCLFTCFDTVQIFNDTKIVPGLYYVETDNYFPLHANGWYYHNMICYCIENNIIKLDNIKYVIKSSLTLKHDYFNGFIEHINKYVPEHSKLAINSMIGTFNRNLKKHETWKSISFTPNSCDAFNSYLKYKGSFIDVKHIGDIKYYHTFEKMFNTQLETESPIYNQIINQEQIELHKLSKLVQSHGGTVLDYNTDAINCIFEGNKFPFELVEKIQLNNHYWDVDNKVYKYKIECDKERLKTSRMQQSSRTNKYVLDKYYNWRITHDVQDNDFTPLVDKIIKSDQSWFINGPGGAGKTYLVKLIQNT